MNCWQTDKVVGLTLLLALVQGQGFAQSPSFVAYTGKQEIEIRKGKEHLLKLSFVIGDEFYIQGNKLENEFFIPTELTVTPSEGIVIGDIQYPQATKYHYEEENMLLDIYTKTLVITVPIQVIDSESNPPEMKVQGSLYYQACSKVKCFYPRTLDFTVNIQVKPKRIASGKQ
jgi:hypothetical protein